jgi:diguanylate cyclase (GGDEF)-like protein/PAS domain S-box-containing protein
MKKKIPSIGDQFHKSLIDNLYDGVYFVDTKRLITYWNKGAERITGYCAQDVLGRFCHANILDHVTDEGQHLCSDGCPLLATIRDGEPRESQVHLRHADGYRVPVLVRTTPMYDDKHKIIGAVEVFSNNQSLLHMKERVNELEKDVFRDALTEVGNRKLLELKIGTALHEYHQQHIPFGLLFLDVDRFKSINDTYGHHEGDRVLRTVAATLTEHLRNTDVCGRWGGEEFVVLLQNVNAGSLAQIAEKLRAMIANSGITINTVKIPITVSMGGILAREIDTLDSLIERADGLIMYQSKQNGRNCVTTEE